MPGLRDTEFMALTGLPQAKEQMRQLPEVLRGESFSVISRQAEQMAVRAAAFAPVRRDSRLRGYTGGQLRAHIKGRASRPNLIGLVGIERGALVILNGQTRTFEKSTTARYYDERGKLRPRRRVLSAHRRAQIARLGGTLVQPTRYGHLMEFGTSRGLAPKSFMRTAANASRMSFESDMRAIAPDLIRALQQFGYQPGRGGTA